MREMNQRWRKRDAALVLDAVGCNVWGMEREKGRRWPQSNPKTNAKLIKKPQMKHSLLNKTNATSDASSNTQTTTARTRKTYGRDAVLSNEKDEPKMTKARCSLQTQCRCLQCVRDGEIQGVEAAPIKPKTKSNNRRWNINYSIQQTQIQQP